MEWNGTRLRKDPNSKLRFGLLQLRDGFTTHRVIIRNLSEKGLTAEGPLALPIGTQVRLLLRNNGWAEGVVSATCGNGVEIDFLRDVESSGEQAVRLEEQEQA